MLVVLGKCLQLFDNAPAAPGKSPGGLIRNGFLEQREDAAGCWCT